MTITNGATFIKKKSRETTSSFTQTHKKLENENEKGNKNAEKRKKCFIFFMDIRPIDFAFIFYIFVQHHEQSINVL